MCGIFLVEVAAFFISAYSKLIMDQNLLSLSILLAIAAVGLGWFSYYLSYIVALGKPGARSRQLIADWGHPIAVALTIGCALLAIFMFARACMP